MANIRKLKYKGVVVENLNYKGTPVDKALYNNIVVYQNDDTTPPTLVDPIDTTVKFELYPEFVPHNSNALQPVISSGDVYNIPEVYLVGNANFFIRMEAENVNDVTIARTNNRWDYIYKFENYGYGFIRSFGYSDWRGGSSGWYENVVTFTPNNNTSLAKSLNIHANTDEDNTTFFRGLFTSRLIRVPAIGLHTNITVQFYPYNFDSKYYYSDTRAYEIEDNVGDIADNTVIKTCQLSEVGLDTAVDATVAVPMTVTDNGLECSVQVEINTNLSNGYKKNMLHFTRESGSVNVANMSGAEICFVQEYRSNNRIYYGTVPKEPKYWENYAVHGLNADKYDYIFQFTNSEIVTSSKEISALRADNTSYSINVLCVPASLVHTITPSISSLDILSDNYMWGDQSYIIYKLASSADTTYTLNIG